MRRIMANDNDYNTDTSTYDTSVTNVSDVDALVMMPVAMIMMLITRRLQPNHGNCAHSDVDNDPDNDNDNDNDRCAHRIMISCNGYRPAGSVEPLLFPRQAVEP